MPLLTLEGEYPRPLSDVTERAMVLYYEKLQVELEPEQIGRGLAIHPDSGDYLVADAPTHAGHAMRRLHPEGGTVTLRIGLKPDYALLARIGPKRMRGNIFDAAVTVICARHFFAGDSFDILLAGRRWEQQSDR